MPPSIKRLWKPLMSSWNYRIVQYRNHPGSLVLHEVHYDYTGQVRAVTENAAAFGCGAEEGKEGIIIALKLALADVERLPILEEPIL
jgi:hypothetical protein